MEDYREEERIEFKDDFVRDLVVRANRTISNENFEKEVMQSIHDSAAYRKDVHLKLKRAIYFFCLGMMLIIVYALITIFGKSTLDLLSGLIPIVTLFVTLVLGVVIIGNLKRILRSFSI